MTTPLQQYFSQYHAFTYDPQQPAFSEFQRLAAQQGWNPRNKRRSRAFKSALVAQFNENFGVDENSLTGWQALCEVLSVNPIPQSVAEAKKVCISLETGGSAW